MPHPLSHQGRSAHSWSAGQVMISVYDQNRLRQLIEWVDCDLATVGPLQELPQELVTD